MSDKLEAALGGDWNPEQRTKKPRTTEAEVHAMIEAEPAVFTVPTNPLVDATLALAYEQRTANLIALWSHPHSSLAGAHANHEQYNIGWSIGENTLGSLLETILKRLDVQADGTVKP